LKFGFRKIWAEFDRLFVEFQGFGKIAASVSVLATFKQFHRIRSGITKGIFTLRERYCVAAVCHRHSRYDEQR
jgi:hypothetical protein